MYLFKWDRLKSYKRHYRYKFLMADACQTTLLYVYSKNVIGNLKKMEYPAKKVSLLGKKRKRKEKKRT